MRRRLQRMRKLEDLQWQLEFVSHTHEIKKRKEVHAISRELQWYNQIVGHVGIHGQRRFTEALATGRAQKATQGCEEGDMSVRSGSRIATGRMSP
ncbi:hypothetical protein Taro_033368 [Colocasia esculenta]|uniref:Uncharacterized protein n=1 Tax=Colocasia esculenta TaxID=4460 RepID=A0A843VTN5_COLES|nr:hypothetical protein [Colocasia esculenta]